MACCKEFHKQNASILHISARRNPLYKVLDPQLIRNDFVEEKAHSLLFSMPAGRSWGWSSFNLRSILELVRHYKSYSSNVWQAKRADYTLAKLGNGYSMHQGLRLISSSSSSSSPRTWREVDSNVNKAKDDRKGTPPGPSPPWFNFPTWAKWALGFLLTFFLPLWKKRWGQLKMIEGQAEVIVEEVETAAEVVEKVATAAEKMSEEAAEKLPEDSKLKEAAVFIERVSKAAAQDAHVTQEFIHKVDKLKDDFEDLETMVGPVIEKIVHPKSGEK